MIVVAVDEIGDEGFVRDLQRIVAAESAWIGDDRFDELAVGGEGGLQTESVIVVDGADADEGCYTSLSPGRRWRRGPGR